MSFGEQGDKFRRIVHTNKGPMYVERHDAPALPPSRWFARLVRWVYNEPFLAALFVVAVVVIAAGINENSDTLVIVGCVIGAIWHALPRWEPRDGR